MIYIYKGILAEYCNDVNTRQLVAWYVITTVVNLITPPAYSVRVTIVITLKFVTVIQFQDCFLPVSPVILNLWRSRRLAW
jgi:hypothetical protein